VVRECVLTNLWRRSQVLVLDDVGRVGSARRACPSSWSSGWWFAAGRVVPRARLRPYV